MEQAQVQVQVQVQVQDPVRHGPATYLALCGINPIQRPPNCHYCTTTVSYFVLYSTVPSGSEPLTRCRRFELLDSPMHMPKLLIK